jgi:signal transduction histidine kinase
MRQVSADIAHDLRTPLNRLRIWIEAAQVAEAGGRPAGADLAAALAESDALAQTFAALLRIAQVESGSPRARFVGLDLAAVVRSVAEVYEGVAAEAGMTLVCRAETPAPIVGDKELLTQVMANLIENALRHCSPGTAITCSVQVPGPSVIAAVADTGPGIPETERENVLRRLYRLEKSRSTEGSGLGLALVKAVAEVHDAELVLGDAGPGLVVTLRFPRAAG